MNNKTNSKMKKNRSKSKNKITNDEFIKLQSKINNHSCGRICIFYFVLHYEQTVL